jgi:AraC-like DNA-binding protein
MATDRLQALLQRFDVRARAFHAGPLCGMHAFDEKPGIGQLHLVRRGQVQAWHGGAAAELVEGPSLVFYPRPRSHRFVTDPERGADMACADVELGGGSASPIVQALPPVLVMPLAELAGAAAVLELLFDEAFGSRCGRRPIVDRLFEVIVVLLLRRLIDGGRVADGTLAGLAHPQLARALVALHEAPARTWTNDGLAAVAGMSRSRFAAAFTATVGVPPAAYLARYRIAVAQDLLRRGRALGTVADEVGYGSTAALSRAFRAQCGMAPRQWKAAWSTGSRSSGLGPALE